MALSLSRRLLKVNHLRALQTVVQSRTYAEAGSGLQLTFGTPTQVKKFLSCFNSYLI